MEQSEIEILVGELETRVDRLRSLYEQYFMGIEKLEPGVPRKDVERRFQTLRREQIRNTALRFRFQMVLQRYNTYQSYWMRICRQIEDGTYRRDLVRTKLVAQRRATAAEADSAIPEPDDSADSIDVLLDFSEETGEVAASPPSSRPSSRIRALAPPLPPRANPPSAPEPGVTVTPAKPPPPPQSPAAPAPSSAASPGATRPRPEPKIPASGSEIPDQRLRELYSRYVEIKRSRKESTAGITFDNLAKSLRESSAKLKARHGAKNVDFEVVVKNNQTILRPVLKS